jgi:TRAP-type C4-dicarboxylate transport system permease small subunit
MLGRIETLFLYISILAIVLLAVMITGNVVTRALFGVSIPDAIVIVKELMVAAIVLPLAMATATRSHVVVEFLAARFPMRIQGWLIVFGSIMGLLALAPLIYAGVRELRHTVETGEYFFGDMELPKWPGRLIFLLGLVVCWLRFLALAAQDIRALRAGDLRFVTGADQFEEGI